MIKYAIFDLDDTLLDFERGEIEGVTKLLKQYQVKDIQKGLAIYLKINQAIWTKIEQGADRTKLLNTRFKKAFGQLGIDVDGVKLEKRYRKMLNHNYYKIDDADALLNDIHQAGITVIAATNGVKKTQIDRLNGSGLMKYFDDYFISEDSSFSKPDKKFFDPIFKTYPNIRKDNTVMIGNRLPSDILGAINAGISSIWFNPKHKINHLNYLPTYETDSYRGIEDIILHQWENKQWQLKSKP